MNATAFAHCPKRIRLTIKARWLNDRVCNHEKKLLERLDQTILADSNNPERTQQNAAIGTVF